MNFKLTRSFLVVYLKFYFFLLLGVFCAGTKIKLKIIEKAATLKTVKKALKIFIATVSKC